MSRKAYRCEFMGIDSSFGDPRARVKLLEDHAELGGIAGEFCTTSPLRSIDFERCVAITRNSIYHWSNT